MYGGGRESEVRIVLVGKSGGGRSATGNSILGWKAFESALGMKATTVTCQSGRGSWEGQSLLVVDTADIFNSQPCGEDTLREILRCLELSRPGPHALVFVTQVGRFTAEDEAAAERVLEVFGAEAARHMLVLFTRREDLGGEPLRDYIHGSDNKAIQALIQKCGGRVCAFNNRAIGEERERQVSVLMEIVGGIVRENRRHYVNVLYLEPGPTTAKLQSFMAENKRARQGGFWGPSLIGMPGGSTWIRWVAFFLLVVLGLMLFSPFVVVLVLVAPFIPAILAVILAVWIFCWFFLTVFNKSPPLVYFKKIVCWFFQVFNKSPPVLYFKKIIKA